MLDTIGESIGMALRSGLFIWGLVWGFALGYVVAVCRRAFRDWRTVSKSVPGFRRGAFRTVPRVIKWGAIAGAGLIFAIAGMTAAADEVPTQPASVPSGGPSSSAPSGR